MNWRYRHTVLLFTVLAFFSLSVARLVISPVVPDIIDAFDVSTGWIGLALTGMWAVYALLQFPSGVLGERFGERRLVLAALGLASVGSLLVAVSPSYPLFAVFVIFLGAGTGLYFSVAASLLTKLFDNTGQALGLHAAGATVAGLVAPVAAAALGVRYGWRVAILLGAVVTIPAFALFAWRIRPTVPERPDGRLRERFEPATLVELLSRPAIAYTTFIAATAAFSFQAFASFFPTFLIEYRGLGPEAASVLFGSVFVLSSVALPIIGRLSDIVGRDAAIAFVLSMNAAGFLAFVLGTGALVTGFGVVALGIGMAFTGAIQSRLMDHLGEDEQGTGFGLVRTVYLFLSALGNVITGVLADVATWPVAYGFTVGLIAVALGSLGAVRLVRLVRIGRGRAGTE